MSGKLTAILMLAFAAVCASTSIDNIDIPCDDTCSQGCITGLQGIDITHVCGQPAGDTPPTLPGECTGSDRCLTCIIETSCASTSPGPDICADTSKKCKPKKCKIYKCKKTCGLCVEPIQSPEPSPGPDTCAGLKDNEKKCKKMIKKKQCKKNPTKCKEKYKEKCSKHKKTKKWCKETCCHILAFPSSPP